jgi:hypothetical protein
MRFEPSDLTKLYYSFQMPNTTITGRLTVTLGCFFATTTGTLVSIGGVQFATQKTPVSANNVTIAGSMTYLTKPSNGAGIRVTMPTTSSTSNGIFVYILNGDPLNSTSGDVTIAPNSLGVFACINGRWRAAQ